MNTRLAAMRLVLAALVLSLATPLAAFAQTYPTHEIRFIVPWNAGGAADIVSRLLAKLAAEDGLTFVVENAPGATGSIGLARVAAAKPDGYTIGLATSSQLALVAQGLTRTKNSEFSVLNQVTTDNYLLIVNKDGPATVKAFVERIRQNPDKVSIGTAGGNNVPHIFAAATSALAGAPIVHVPYPGAAKAIVDLSGGQIDAGILKPSESKGQIDAGYLRALAVYADARVPALPDVPTFKESGLEAFPWGPVSNISWLVTPAKVSPAIRARLIAVFDKAMHSAEFRQYAHDNGFAVPTLSGDELDKTIVSAQSTFDSIAPRVFKKEP